MNILWDLLQQGGPVMVPLMLLSVLLYERCFGLYFMVRRANRRLRGDDVAGLETLTDVRMLRLELSEKFQQHRFVVSTLIAAAPLMGLLGTVTGMISTFQSLVDRSGQKSFEGLADGISVALITTETGLAIAIPAVILLHFAHRHQQHGEQSLVKRESILMEAA
ncbi:MotA/TolQ/ExbB proton channel family protein [Synoicihabitans lomoniglobus]|uniref:MotA/TolQ/ExbB proton channel family protein n=1 Tax=Synoicihabitans lomoniglobus TaxID=2909285 RepID=A0AAE9ZW87_9BACT|nr:MotA/TolQ/ExbB proton channel family protein [Opitutaceae bacterium LMO-M01]WED64030.1 MotA/TolQ/ExbB proton channel family protein [Opitutaceae bacterium LMO-M01]